MKFLRHLKFTIITGYFTGLIFTQNPLKFAPFQSWRSIYSVYAVAIGIYTVLFNLDYRIYIFPYLVSKATDRSDFARTLLQGFVLAHVALVGLLRFMLVLRAKEISALIVAVKNVHECKAGSFKPRLTISILVVVTVCHVALHSVASLSFDRSRSWLSALNDLSYAILAVFAYGLHCATSLVAFALITDLLTGLLVAFEELCGKVQCGLGGGSAETGGFEEAGKTGLNPEMELLTKFLEISGLFEKYDRFVGPAILLSVLVSSMAVVQVLNEVWNVGYGLGTDLLSSLPWANLLQHAACLILLDTGFKAMRRVSS